MPELPEAETIATQLDRCLAGARFGRVLVRRRDVIESNGLSLSAVLPGRRVLKVTRRGKRVVVRLEPAGCLVFRLGMTGQILVADSDERRDRHVHLRIGLDGTRELRFRDVRRFGGVWFSEGDGAAGATGLGPEPLEITAKAFDRLMSRRRQIKALLLDQSAIAGLGNIYCDEALYAAGVHPLTRASDMGPQRRKALFSAIRRILRQAIRAGGSTLNDYRTASGEEGSFQTHHRVYGRSGEACRACGAVIQRIQAAGRSTHLCPVCQPLAAGTA
ncbi:MAG: bifunctional DNA-formamidopyrimidine glycosylase/DNA-(apurinic or apyrimidinic site) lyase [Phycisphaerae bacterium]